MNFATLGKTGLRVSRICLGTMTYGSSKWRPWVLDEEASRPLIRSALDAGINFFDTADMYSLGQSEEVLGRALKDFAPRREDLVIATKVFYPMSDDPGDRGLSRKHITAAIDASLRRLGTDYVDLYQIHRFDEQTPIDETLEALDDVVTAGKARHLGASSMPSWRFMKMLCRADARGWRRFSTMQNHYNLIYREEEREMIPLCLEEGIGVLPWSPLARGLLTGRRPRATARAETDTYGHDLYGKAISTADAPVLDALKIVAGELAIPEARIALAWLLQKPGVTAPIVGISKPGQLEDAIAALEVPPLPAAAVAKLEQAYAPHAVAGI